MPREASKCREWEKERRNRLNNSFGTLSKKLPCYQPSVNISKIDILEKAAGYIDELETQIKELLSNSSTSKISFEKIKKLRDQIKKLLVRNEQLCNLLKDAGIRFPSECGTVKFRSPKKWTNKISREQAKILAEKETQKEKSINSEKIKKKPNKVKKIKGNTLKTKQKVSVKRKDHKKIIQSAFRLNIAQTNLINLVSSQSCFIITKASTHCPSNLTKTRTVSQNMLLARNIDQNKIMVLTNSTIFSTPLVASNIKPSGKFLFANTNILPVIHQPLVPTPILLASSTPISNQPSLVASSNPIIVNTGLGNCSNVVSSILTNAPIIANTSASRDTLIQPNNLVTTSLTLSKSNLTTTRANEISSSVVKSGVVNLPSKPKLPLLRPKAHTTTTHVNKVPIPSLSTEYNKILLHSLNLNNSVKNCFNKRKEKVKLKSKRVNIISQKILLMKRVSESSLQKKIDSNLHENNEQNQDDENITNEPKAKKLKIDDSSKKSSITYSIDALCNDVPDLNGKMDNLTSHSIRRNDNASLEKEEENKQTLSPETIKGNENNEEITEVVTVTKNQITKNLDDNLGNEDKVDISDVILQEQEILGDVSVRNQDTSSECKDSENNKTISGNRKDEKVQNTSAKEGNIESNKNLNDSISESQKSIEIERGEIQIFEKSTIKNIELNDTSVHSELSNDIFASLSHVSAGGQNPESTSPTAAFLLAFPLVSSLNSLKVAEVIEDETTESQHGTPTLLQIGTMDTTKTTQSQNDNLTPSLLNLDNFSFFPKEFYPSFDNIIASTTSEGMGNNAVCASSSISTVGSAVNVVTSIVNSISSTFTAVTSTFSALTSTSSAVTSTFSASNSTFNAVTSSFNAVTSSFNAVASTFSTDTSSLNSITSSFNTVASSFNTVTTSFNTVTSSLNSGTSTFNSAISSYNPATSTLSTTTPKVNSVSCSNAIYITTSCNTIIAKTHSEKKYDITATRQRPTMSSQIYSIAKSETMTYTTPTTIIGDSGRQQIRNFQLQNLPTGNSYVPSSISYNLQYNHSFFGNAETVPPGPVVSVEKVNEKQKDKKACYYPVNSTYTVPTTNTLTQYNTFNPFTDIPTKSTSYVPPKPYNDMLYTNNTNYSYNYPDTFNSAYTNVKSSIKNDKAYYGVNYENCEYKEFQKYEDRNQQYCYNSNQNLIREKGSILKSNSAHPNTRPPVNWMTTPDVRHQVQEFVVPPLPKEVDFTPNPIYSSNSFAAAPPTTYFSANNSLYSSGDFNTFSEHKKVEGFPTIPPNTFQRNEEDNQFSWSPSKLPQLLDPPHSFVSSTLPTLVGDLALGTPQVFTEQKDNKSRSKETRRKVNFDNQNNFLSVSQLVDHSKDGAPSRVANRRSSGSRSTKPNSSTKSSKKTKPELNKEMQNYVVQNKNVLNERHKHQNQNEFNNQTNENWNKNRSVKNHSSNYSAEALIGHQNIDIRQRNHQTYPVVNKSLPVPFLAENLIPYFPPVDLPQDNTLTQQNQNYQGSSFGHNFSSSIQNSVYSNNSFVPNPITTSYLPSTNFIPDIGNTDYSTGIIDNSFGHVLPRPSDKCNKKGNLNERAEEKRNVSTNNCSLNTPKKTRKKQTNESTLSGLVDFSILPMPGAINSPILPDDFHSHNNFLAPPTTTQLYPCKNPLYGKQPDLVHNNLLPLPPATRTGVPHPDISPSLNSMGSSLTNFNLSTIFPEINKGSGVILDIYPDANKAKDYAQRDFLVGPQMPFSKSNSTMGYINSASTS